MNNQLITIVGMGKGISLGIAKRFAKEGFSVAMISRSEERLQVFQSNLKSEGFDAHYFVADVSNEESLQNAFWKIKSELGDCQVLVYNAAALKSGNILKENFSSLVDDFKVNTAAALTATQEVLPAMETKQEGSILFTGGGFADYPNQNFATLSIGKASLKSLAKILFQELNNKGIHVGLISIMDYVREEHPKYNSTAIAEVYWNLHIQKKGEFESEIVY